MIYIHIVRVSCCFFLLEKKNVKKIHCGGPWLYQEGAVE